MRLREVILRGGLGRSSPTSLDVSDRYTRIDPPDSLGIDEVRALLWALLFPDRDPLSGRPRLPSDGDPKLRLLFTSRRGTFRLDRTGLPESATLERETGSGFETVASGASDVGQELDVRHGRPAPDRFAALNLWQFGAVPQNGSDSMDLGEIGPEKRELVAQYRRALEVRRLDQKIGQLEDEYTELEDEMGEVLEVESTLRRAEERLESMGCRGISEADIELLETKDERCRRLEDELAELTEQEQREREAGARRQPSPIWSQSRFWTSAAIGLAALAVSGVATGVFRWVALIDIPAFGVVAWDLIVHLTARERARIHRVRVDSIRRRIDDARRTLAELRERVDHLLIEAEADDEVELLERGREALSLRERVDDLRARAEAMSGDESLAGPRERARQIEEQLDGLRQRRAQLPDYPPEPYQLEMELDRVGIDPERIREGRVPRDPGSGAESTQNGDEPFDALHRIARGMDLVDVGGLARSPRRLWRKMTDHVLGDRFSGVDLGSDGTLEIEGWNGSEIDEWREARPGQARSTAELLALALKLTALDDSEVLETVWVADPAPYLDPEARRRLEDVFSDAAQRCHFVIDVT